MARIGIVGLPNVGRTTLFNALTGLDAVTAPHPYATTQPNVGVATVPDDALDRAGAVEGSAKIVHATLELLDVPAAPGAGAGVGPEGLGKLREMEALAVVLRAFSDPAVPSDDSGIDPVEQAENFVLELSLADAEVFAKRAERSAKEATADSSRKREAEAIGTASALLAEGTPLRSGDWSDEEESFFRDMAPLSLKPVVWVVNVAEDDSDDWEEKLLAVVPSSDTVVTLSAQIEEEGSRLDPADRAELFDGLGLGEGALAKLVRASHQALGLISFYTLGPKEAHAWTVRRDSTARDAAGKIHSDLERGFIRAEVANIGEVIEAGGWDVAKAAGMTTVEGQDYVVGEGDVILVRFSV
jgi:hypothetical protein